MKQELLDYKDAVGSVQLLSKQVTPMHERKAEMKASKPVKAICDFNQASVSINLYVRLLSHKARLSKREARSLLVCLTGCIIVVGDSYGEEATKGNTEGRCKDRSFKHGFSARNLV